MKFNRREFYPTIWAFGWYRYKGYGGKTIDFRLFIGPFVWSWYR